MRGLQRPSTLRANRCKAMARVIKPYVLVGLNMRTKGTPMAKFLRIGVHHSNVSGYTSKALPVRRVGSTVLLKWGALEVRGAGYGRRIYWASPPRQKTVSCDTEKRARDYVKKRNFTAGGPSI
jgi:hypothetical protein